MTGAGVIVTDASFVCGQDGGPGHSERHSSLRGTHRRQDVCGQEGGPGHVLAFLPVGTIHR